MSNPTIGISSAPDTALARVAAHLEAAFWHAHASAGDDLLSPWAHTAHAIDIAAGAVHLNLSGPVEPASHPDCLSALLAADQELTQLPPDESLPLVHFVLVRTRLTTALRETRALQT
jgi:hypothetical protein